MSSTSLIFPVEVFKVLALDRVHLHHLRLQLVFMVLQMGLVKEFFALFPKVKKSAQLASHSGSALLPESSPSTRAAQLEDSVEWAQLKDGNSGKPYYWNRRTFSTVWKPPSGVKVVWVGERNEEGGVWYTGTGSRVSPRLTSLLFLLGKELYRQPRAVYKYWAGAAYVPVSMQRQVPAFLRVGLLLPFIDKVLDIPVMLHSLQLCRYAVRIVLRLWTSL